MATLTFKELKLSIPENCSLEDLIRQICIKSKQSFYVKDGLTAQIITGETKLPPRVKLTFSDETDQEYHYRDSNDDSLYAVFGLFGKKLFDTKTDKPVLVPVLTIDQIE